MAEKPGKVMKVIAVTEDGEVEEGPSKQLPEDPFKKAYKYSGIQEPPYDTEKLMVLAEGHPTHSAILEQKAADIVGTGWEWVAKDTEGKERDEGQRTKLEEWFESLADDKETDDTTHDILLSTVDDVETFGQGFIELARDPSGKLQYWFRTPAHTFRFHRDGVRIMQIRGNKRRWFKRWIADDERKVDQATGKLDKDVDNPGNELLVLRRASRRSTWYGVPKYLSAVGDLALSIAARDDNFLFFQNRREPRWLIILENVDADQDLEEVIKEAMRHDLKAPYRNLVLPLAGGAKATFHKLGTDRDDSSWQNLQAKVDEAVLLAHRMPGERIGMVRSGPLGGNAVSAASRVYKEAFVSTSQELLASRINKLIEHESEIDSPKWTWKPTELDLQEDQANKESALKLYQGDIITLDEAREAAGEEALEDGDERGGKFHFELAKGQQPGGLPADQGQLADANLELAQRIDDMLGQ